jgi:hypothetical protein
MNQPSHRNKVTAKAIYALTATALISLFKDFLIVASVTFVGIIMSTSANAAVTYSFSGISEFGSILSTGQIVDSFSETYETLDAAFRGTMGFAPLCTSVITPSPFGGQNPAVGGCRPAFLPDPVATTYTSVWGPGVAGYDDLQVHDFNAAHTEYFFSSGAFSHDGTYSAIPGPSSLSSLLSAVGTLTVTGASPPPPLSIYVTVEPDTQDHLSDDGKPTRMTASATLATSPPSGDSVPIPDVTLSSSVTNFNEAAAELHYVGFDWRQTVDILPFPSTSFAAKTGPLFSLFAPPAFADPPKGGYVDVLGRPIESDTYPFYFEPISYNQKHGATTTLPFDDTPNDGLLLPWQFMYFTTYLVPVLSDGNGLYDGPSLFEFSWKSNYNGTTGGVHRLNSDVPADPNSGTGGVILLSVNGVPVHDVPEPASLALLASSLLCFRLICRRRCCERSLGGTVRFALTRYRSSPPLSSSGRGARGCRVEKRSVYRRAVIIDWTLEPQYVHDTNEGSDVQRAEDHGRRRGLCRAAQRHRAAADQPLSERSRAPARHRTRSGGRLPHDGGRRGARARGGGMGRKSRRRCSQ